MKSSQPPAASADIHSSISQSVDCVVAANRLNYCYCYNCISALLQQLVGDTSKKDGNIGDNVKLQQTIDPRKVTYASRILWHVTITAILILQYVCTLTAIVYLCTVLVLFPRHFGSWTTFLAILELVWAVLGYVDTQSTAKYFAACKMAPFSKSERWRYFTETLRVIHPSTIQWKNDNASTVSDQQKSDSFRRFLESSRPLASSCGQPYHTVNHIGTFLSGWFLGENICQIKRGNLEEWFAWAFFNHDSHKMHIDNDYSHLPLSSKKLLNSKNQSSSYVPEADDNVFVRELEELNTMIAHLEQQTNIKLEDGYNDHVKCIRLNLDDIRVSYFPGLVHMLGTGTSFFVMGLLNLIGFKTYHSPDKATTLHVPHSLLSSSTKSSNSKQSLRPIFFFHGLGLGILPYVPFLCYTYFITRRPIIFLNVPSISIRLFSSPPPTRIQLVSFIQSVLIDQLHFDVKYPDGITFFSHSLGSTFCAWLIKWQAEVNAKWQTEQATISTYTLFNDSTNSLRQRNTSRTRDSPAFTSINSSPLQPPTLIRDLIFVDPVCFGLCWFDVAYNFVYKRPRTWTQAIMRYFVGRYPSISGYLYRHFWWYENILFKFDWEQIGRKHQTDELTMAYTTSNPSMQAPVITTPNTTPVIRIFLSEYDSIVNCESVYQYLQREDIQPVQSLFSATSTSSEHVVSPTNKSQDNTELNLVPYATVCVVPRSGHAGLLASFAWWRELATALNVNN